MKQEPEFLKFEAYEQFAPVQQNVLTGQNTISTY